MALNGFSVHSPSTVILDDARDPDVSWANHERRYPGQSNRGGVDVVAPVGTPVHAWADGTVRNLANQGSAGNVAHLDLARHPGWSMEAKHLSRFAVPDGQWVAAGTVIGYSGTSGGVAPHVHYNLLDPRGIRRNPWHYIDAGETAASKIQEEEMAAAVLLRRRNGTIGLAADNGDFTVLATLDEVAALEATGAVRPVMVDGKNARWIQLSDDLIWNLRAGIAARKKK